jgi:hypothetical protein
VEVIKGCEPSERDGRRVREGGEKGKGGEWGVETRAMAMEEGGGGGGEWW